MELLATIRPTDVDPGAPDFDYENFYVRTAARAIVFDGPKVALIYVGADGYYMLPGGGIEGDGMQAGLEREVREEVGVRVRVTEKIGSILVYNDRWRAAQTDHCFVAHKVGSAGTPQPTPGELDAGYQIVWVADLDEAVRLVEDTVPQARDGKIMRARDLRFLQTAQAML